jgi:serine/threonine-protein kinase
MGGPLQSIGSADMGNDPHRQDTVRVGALSALLQELVRAEDPVPGSSSWSEALRPGATVGRFELVRELGRGGFGVVWEARDRELGRTVALKAVRPGAREALREERLLQEAEAAARLSHPNIVTLFDVGRTEHGPFLVLELLRGQSLARRLDQGPVPLREALAIASEVAKGLACAHAAGVVHRDLTPGNIFLCADGQVKVLDLGMAHAFGRRKVEGGTPAYMAPEQRRGAPEDERTDVFALGVILFRMLAGEPPFGDGDGKASRGPPATPRLEVPALPALEPFVSRMLARDPVKRPRDAADVSTVLLALLRELERAPSGIEPARVRRQRPSRRAATAAPVPSVAVLPFLDMSPEHDQEYFSDGLAEEILNALARVDGLRVIGRTSSFSFKGSAHDLRTIGRKLGVSAVMEGSVRKQGNRVRISAQLTSTSDGSRVWAHEYDRELVDIFAIQEEIARAVVAALKVKLLPESGPIVKGGKSVDPEVYGLALRGQELLKQDSGDGYRQALNAFERAVALDPGYAPAWAGIAVAARWVGGALDDYRWREAKDRSLAAADRAVTLDPWLAAAYRIRAQSRRAFLWDWAGAQADLRRALELSPNDAANLVVQGNLLTSLGRTREAIATLDRATKLDPLLPEAWLLLGWSCLAAGEADRARASLERLLEIAPSSPLARDYLMVCHLVAGEPRQALEVASGSSSEWIRLTGEALALGELGDLGGAERALEALTVRHDGQAPYQIAEVHAWQGRSDLAFEWLHRANDHNDPGLGWIKVDPLLRRLRGDSRYLAMLRQLNLPVE